MTWVSWKLVIQGDDTASRLTSQVGLPTIGVIVRGLAKGMSGLGVVVLLGLCATVPLVDEAKATMREKSDRGNELRFSLDGSMLTLAIFDRPNLLQSPTIQDDLFGQRVWAGCGTSFRVVSRRTVIGRVVRWPQSVNRISVQLSRDVSRRAKWCLVEARGRFAGGDIAFVSFYKAEPGRRVASGQLLDGARWRLVAWRGNKLQPCLQTRLTEIELTYCFDDEAETEAGIEATFDVPTCDGGTLVLGAVSRVATRVDVRLGDGRIVPATLRPRPRGSRVKAQYFTALVEGRPNGEPADVTAVVAYDANGKLIARDRGINGSGTGNC